MSFFTGYGIFWLTASLSQFICRPPYYYCWGEVSNIGMFFGIAGAVIYGMAMHGFCKGFGKSFPTFSVYNGPKCRRDVLAGPRDVTTFLGSQARSLG